MKKRKKKNTQKARPVWWLIRLGVVGVSLSLLVAFFQGQAQVAGKEQELAELQIQVQQQTQENQELQQLIDSGDEDAFVERIAREKLGYARPNERVFLDIAGE